MLPECPTLLTPAGLMTVGLYVALAVAVIVLGFQNTGLRRQLDQERRKTEETQMRDVIPSGHASDSPTTQDPGLIQ